MSNKQQAIKEQDKRKCGTCKYHEWDGLDFECRNPISEYNSDYTGWKHVCDDWEERDGT